MRESVLPKSKTYLISQQAGRLDLALRVRHMSMTLLLSRFTSKKALFNNRS